MITVSACMIVKNEAKVLTRCLDSLKDLADEIIIVDTGSTDETKRIARRYTDKVYDFLWTDDFSEARNFSFEKASMDYIYTADADEVIDEENRRRFLQMKEALLPEIEIVQMYYANQLAHNTVYNFDREYRPKLYKRLRRFRWAEPVHEAVVLEPVIWDSDIEICHMPEENHGPRDFTIFKKAAAGGGLSKKMKRMYVRELFIAGTDRDFAEARPYFEKEAGAEDLTEEEFKLYQCVLVRAARIAGDEKEFFRHCLRHVASGQPYSEVCFELGEYYLGKGDYEEAALWYGNAAHETEAAASLEYQTNLPLDRLSRCAKAMGESGEF